MKQAKRKKKKKRNIAKNVDVIEQINLDAAGIDIGATEIFVCVPPNRSEEQIRSFATFTVDLEEMADWLLACNVKTVAMESTGVYWLPIYDILVERGLEVYLVNARHVKNVSGRKSAVSDCQWLYQLHTYGLLQASFHPEDEIRALRILVRHRDMLVKYRAAHIQHMQKAMEQMNIKLTYVLSDITGVTGMQIIRSIVAGERDPKVLASYRQSGCKHSEADIEKALHGHYRVEYLFALEQALALYEMYGQKMAEVDQQLEKMYADMNPSSDEPPTTTPPLPSHNKRRKNQPHFPLALSLYRIAGVDLTQINGIEALSAQVVLSEIGTDMSKWPSVKHFTSWAGLSPNHRITGGQIKSRRTKKTKSRLNTTLRLAARSVARTQSHLGAFYRRIKHKHGAPVAIVATAHKLARIIYFMLKNRTDFNPISAEQDEERQRQRTIKRLTKQAAKLGLRLESSQEGQHVLVS